MTSGPHVLHLTSALALAAGSGPADALARLSRAQAQGGTRVTIVTADPPETVADLHASLGAAGVTVHAAGPPSGPLRKGANVDETLARVLDDGVDLVHVHAIWQHTPHAGASAARRRGIPYLIRTCGMLEPWALRKGRWKKRVFMALKARRDLERAAVLHTTAAKEAGNVRAVVPGATMCIVGNGIDLADYDTAPSTDAIVAEHPELAGKRLLLFLARIDAVKGTAHLAEAWGRLAPAHPEWHLVIAGPDSRGHEAEFRARLREAGVLDRTLFTGRVDGDAKRRLLASADVFVQPSFQENFGITIAEAMASARPVVTTTGTPWHELRDRDCGWWIDIGTEPLVAALDDAMGRAPEELLAMGDRARALIEEAYSWPAQAAKLDAVYGWLLGRGPRPSVVIEPGEPIPAAG